MMANETFPNKILNLFLKICLNTIEKTESIELYFSNIRKEIKQFLSNENINININLSRLEQMINPYNKIDFFDSKDFYFMMINEMYKLDKKKIKFSSYYSFLYFIKSINYLQILNSSNFNVVENKKVKIFLFVSLMLLTDQLNENDKEDLNEAFFKGTFIELKREYSEIQYQDSAKIIELISIWTNEVKNNVNDLINDNFEIFKDLLNEIGNKNDKLIINMKKEVECILHGITVINDNNMSDILKEQIKNFYNKKENLALIYYYIDKTSIFEPIETNSVDSNILTKYNNFNLNGDSTVDEKTKKK